MAFSQLQKLIFESVRLWEKVAQGNGCPSDRVGSTWGGGLSSYPSTVVTVMAMNRVGSRTEKGEVKPYSSRPTSPGRE